MSAAQYRTVGQIQRELTDARRALCGNLPTHARVNRCEKLYAELQAAMARPEPREWR